MALSYKCFECGNIYYSGLPGFNSIIEARKCPCGGTLSPLDTASASKINWFEDGFTSLPSVIAYEYKRLFNLSNANNTYGLILEIKDCIETIIKFTTLSVCAWGKGNQIAGAKKAYEKELTNELLLSDWYEILRLIRVFYSDPARKQEGAQLPSQLYKLTEKVLHWVKHENKDLIKWRNDMVGHGALALEDDPDLQRDIKEKLDYISDFLRTNSAVISSISIICEGKEKSGFKEARDFTTECGPCYLKINGDMFPFEPYITHTQNGLFFYDSLIRQRQAKWLNYPTGQTRLDPNQYILELHDLLKDKGSLMKRTIDSNVVTLRDYNYLARLSINESYVKPLAVLDWIEKSLQENSKGIFLLEMERGCGKTFFSEKLNRRFQSPQDLDGGNIDVRTIHISKTQVGGISRFLSDLSMEWKLAYNQDEFILETRDMPAPAEDPSYNAVALADFLNAWRTDSENYRGKHKIMLVLDGLDEIISSTEIIWSYIPKEKMLENGVYVLLTSRIIDNNQLSDNFINHLNKIEVQSKLTVYASSPENEKTLRSFVKSKKLKNLSDGQINELISRSGFRLLHLSMLCRLVSKYGPEVTHVQGDEEIAISYLLAIEGLYGEKRTVLLKSLLTVLSTFGQHDSLSLQEMADLLSMGKIQFELLDLISDLLPLLVVERGYRNEQTLENDTNRYHFVNEVIAHNVISYIGNSNVEYFFTDLISSLRTELSFEEHTPQYSDGIFSALAHLYTVTKELNMDIDWVPDDIEKMLRYIKLCFDSSPDKKLGRDRYYSALEECYSIIKRLSVPQIETIYNNYCNVIHELESYCEGGKLYKQALEIIDFGLEFQEKRSEKDLLEIFNLLYTKCSLCVDRKDFREANTILREIELIRKRQSLKIDEVKEANLFLFKAKVLLGTPDLSQIKAVDFLDKAINAVKAMQTASSNALLIEIEAEYMKALWYRDTFQEEKAISAFTQNIEYCRTLDIKYPGVFEPWIAHNLNSLGHIYKKRGDSKGNYADWNKSEKIRQEAYAILEKLYAQNKSMYEVDYALLCNTLGNTYRSLGRYEEGKKYHFMATKVRESLYARDELAFKSDLAHSYKNLGHLLADVGNFQEAEVNLNKAIQMYNTLEEPSIRNRNILAALLNMFDMHVASGNRKKAILDLKKIITISDEYAFIKDVPIYQTPSFLKNCNKEIKQINDIRRLVQKRDDLINQSNASTSKNYRKKICYDLCYICNAIFLLQPDVVNAMDFVRSARKYLEASDLRPNQYEYQNILGEIIGFTINFDIQNNKKDKQECLQTADMYNNIQIVFATNQQFPFAIDFAKLALTAFLDYEKENVGNIEAAFIEPICTLYNNIGIWTHSYFKKPAEAIKYLRNAIEYASKHFSDDILFVFFYAASNNHILSILMDPNVNDSIAAEETAKAALSKLEGYIGINSEADDQIIGLSVLLTRIYKLNKKEKEKNILVSKVKRDISRINTLSNQRKQRYLRLLNIISGNGNETTSASYDTEKKSYTLDEAIDITLSHMTRRDINNKILQYFSKDAQKQLGLHGMFKIILHTGLMAGISYSIDSKGIITEYS